MTPKKTKASTTRNRVVRTVWQAAAAGVVAGPLIAWITDDLKALLVALVTSLCTVLATWAQNVLEDAERIRDRRGG